MTRACHGALLIAILAACTARPVGTSTDQDHSSVDEKTPAQEPAGNGGGGASGSSDPSGSHPGADPPPPAAPSSGGPYACSAAGIAAYADALVAAGRKSCVKDGVGVVMRDDYACMKTAITSVAPPHADASFNVIDTLLKDNTQYPYLECTYFVQAVTAGVCGAPISPSDVAWTDYPLAYMFVDKQAAGFTWYANDGKNAVQAGDIVVYDTTGGQDPGHIMIVAEIVDATHFRLAEANELTSSGGQAFQETGVVSSTRVATLRSPVAAGWFRLTSTH